MTHSALTLYASIVLLVLIDKDNGISVDISVLLTLDVNEKIIYEVHLDPYNNIFRVKVKKSRIQQKNFSPC